MSAELIQGSVEWAEARLGKVTASRICDVIAKTKNGYGAPRAAYLRQLIAERLTGAPTEVYRSPAMIWGSENEPKARSLYEFQTDTEVALVGFIDHPTIAMSGASPDGLVGTDGLVEFKCPDTTTHIETLIGGEIPAKHEPQMQWQLACCPDREWCDFGSFDPRVPAHLRLFRKRLYRDEAYIAQVEGEVKAFLAELDEKLAALGERYEHREAA